MKVYLEVGINSRGLQRVRNALVNHKPDVINITKNEKEADLVVLHVYGRHESVEKRVEKLQESKKAYAMIQYAIRSTMEPFTGQWLYMWENAKLVWSYYDLFKLLEEDNYIWERLETHDPFNFYHAPLGVDAEVFQENWRSLIKRNEYVIAASAQHALSESVRECAFAAKRVERKMLHIGHELRRGDDIVCKSDVTDEELAELYSQAEFVAGLRRIEGFELPVIEGLSCGARPIVFDKPHYRKWFSEFAVFIPETPREGVIDNLEKVFRKGATPVTEDEKELVRKRFNWNSIITEFWDRVL